MLTEHRNSRFNIVQAESNRPEFVVIDGQRAPGGYAEPGAKVLTEPLTRTAAIAVADQLQRISSRPEALAAQLQHLDAQRRMARAGQLNPVAADELLQQTYNADGHMTGDQRRAIKQLREAGFAIVIFTPQDLGRADRHALESDLVEAGNGIIETINQIKE